jgi:hypothetical protein
MAKISNSGRPNKAQKPPKRRRAKAAQKATKACPNKKPDVCIRCRRLAKAVLRPENGKGSVLANHQDAASVVQRAKAGLKNKHTPLNDRSKDMGQGRRRQEE